MPSCLTGPKLTIQNILKVLKSGYLYFREGIPENKKDQKMTNQETLQTSPEVDTRIEQFNLGRLAARLAQLNGEDSDIDAILQA